MLTKGQKVYQQSRALVESNRLVFFSRSATTLSFETPGGRIDPPPLAGRVMENGLPGRGLIFQNTQHSTSNEKRGIQSHLNFVVSHGFEWPWQKNDLLIMYYVLFLAVALKFSIHFEYCPKLLFTFNLISDRLLSTPISVRGAVHDPPWYLESRDLTDRLSKFKRHSIPLNVIYISK